jgi:glutathione S-transferase
MLSFIGSEIHKRFPIYLSATAQTQAALRDDILRWFRFVADRLDRGYLFGNAFSAADAYLFVMARGAAELGFPLPDVLRDYISRIESRPSVREALRREA